MSAPEIRVQGTRYCSSICCTASLKEAIIASELSDGNLATTIFYMDLRTPGKNFERYLEQAQRHGVRLIRSRVTQVNADANGDITIRSFGVMYFLPLETDRIASTRRSGALSLVR